MKPFACLAFALVLVNTKCAGLFTGDDNVVNQAEPVEKIVVMDFDILALPEFPYSISESSAMDERQEKRLDITDKRIKRLESIFFVFISAFSQFQMSALSGFLLLSMYITCVACNTHKNPPQYEHVLTEPTLTPIITTNPQRYDISTKC